MNENERPDQNAPLRKRGAPPGNQNARKHGFYATILNESEREALERAIEIRNLRPEIAMLRVRLMSLIASPTASDDLIIKAIRALTRMLEVQRRLPPD